MGVGGGISPTHPGPELLSSTAIPLPVRRTSSLDTLTPAHWDFPTPTENSKANAAIGPSRTAGTVEVVSFTPHGSVATRFPDMKSGEIEGPSSSQSLTGNSNRHNTVTEDKVQQQSLQERQGVILGMNQSTAQQIVDDTAYNTLDACLDMPRITASSLTALPIHLLSMKTVADLQQAIFELYEAQLAQKNSYSRLRYAEISQETLVQEVMEHLQVELDSAAHLKSDDHHSVFGTTGVYYKRCLRTLRQLSVIYKVFPYSFVIQNVKQEGRYAVGGGGFADIYRGIMGEQRVCLKVLRLVMEQHEENRDKIWKEFCNEALIWRQLKHPNILPLLGLNAELFSPSFCLISPWMENRDIITYLRKHPTHKRQTVLSEIAAGLLYLHSREPPIIHGDIRGANILVCDNLHCCLGDFGLSLISTVSQPWSDTTSSAMTKGAIRWMAPELIIPGISTKPTPNRTSGDIYAFGCTVLEILTLQLPFHDQKTDPAVLYSLMLGNRPTRPVNVWYPDPIWDLTTWCWTEEAAARPTAQAINEFLQTLCIDDDVDALAPVASSHVNEESKEGKPQMQEAYLFRPSSEIGPRILLKPEVTTPPSPHPPPCQTIPPTPNEDTEEDPHEWPELERNGLQDTDIHVNIPIYIFIKILSIIIPFFGALSVLFIGSCIIGCLLILILDPQAFLDA